MEWFDRSLRNGDAPQVAVDLMFPGEGRKATSLTIDKPDARNDEWFRASFTTDTGSRWYRITCDRAGVWRVSPES